MEYKLAIARRIRALRPRTVILPYWEGRHPDHYNAARLGYEGCFLAGLKRLDIGAKLPAVQSAVLDDVRSQRAAFVRRGYNERVRAPVTGNPGLRSQFQPVGRERKSKVYIPLDRWCRKYTGGAILRRMIGVEYAEPFLAKEVMQVEDVVDLPVRSI